MNLPAVLRRLGEDRRAVALTEFAILLPVLLTLFVGGYQLMQASACKRRTTITARTLSDLVSQYETVTLPDVTTILDATTQLMLPFDPASARSRVSLVKVDAAGIITIVWSRAKNDTAYTKNALFTGLPIPMRTPGSYYVLGEVTYVYRPFGGRYARPVTFSETLFMVPRQSDAVECPTC